MKCRRMKIHSKDNYAREGWKTKEQTDYELEVYEKGRNKTDYALEV